MSVRVFEYVCIYNYKAYVNFAMLCHAYLCYECECECECGCVCVCVCLCICDCGCVCVSVCVYVCVVNKLLSESLHAVPCRLMLRVWHYLRLTV